MGGGGGGGGGAHFRESFLQQTSGSGDLRTSAFQQLMRYA